MLQGLGSLQTDPGDTPPVVRTGERGAGIAGFLAKQQLGDGCRRGTGIQGGLRGRGICRRWGRTMRCGFADSSRQFRNQPFEAHPFDKRHHIVVEPLLIPHAKDLDDVGMVQVGGDPRLPLKAFQVLIVEEHLPG